MNKQVSLFSLVVKKYAFEKIIFKQYTPILGFTEWVVCVVHLRNKCVKIRVNLNCFFPLWMPLVSKSIGKTALIVASHLDGHRPERWRVA